VEGDPFCLSLWALFLLVQPGVLLLVHSDSQEGGLLLSTVTPSSSSTEPLLGLDCCKG